MPTPPPGPAWQENLAYTLQAVSGSALQTSVQSALGIQNALALSGW
ncbi:MAG: hypothetical protein M3186_04190 [Actinomycetota bacterium]|nr:hypothetical protein [Actinomycetota bacterium]